MTLSDDDITLAYRLFLGRSVQARELEQVQAAEFDLEQLRQMFLNSAEFEQIYLRAQMRHALRAQPHGVRTEETLVHLHVPKTAGTSLNAILLPLFAPNARLTAEAGPPENTLLAMAPEARAAIRLVAGHCVYGIHDLLPGKVRYICVLRDAGARLVSFYKFVRRTEVHPHHKLLARHEATFGTFLEIAADTAALRAEVDNGQCRRVAGKMTGTEADELLYDRACRHLSDTETMRFGLTERFGLFLQSLKREGVIPRVPAVRANVSPPGENFHEASAGLNARQRGLLDDYLHWDAKFHQFASGILDAQRETAETAS